MQWRRRHGTAIDPDAAPLRRAGLRFAATTVVLLAILLIISSALVYVTTRRALQQSLEDTLKSRAQHPPSYIFDIARGLTPGVVFTSPGDAHQDSSGVFYAVLDANGSVLGGAGPFNPPSPTRPRPERRRSPAMHIVARK